jgi:hypothetical protein
MSEQMAKALDGCTLPKLCGADIELGNFLRGVERSGGTGFDASHALLEEIHGYPKHANGYYGALWPVTYPLIRADIGGQSSKLASGVSTAVNPQNIGRRFLSSNAGAAYIDLDHVELCLPEVLSAYDHVAAWHAMLRIARDALNRANAERDPEHRIEVLVNNSDGLGKSSYGSHLNFLISRRAYDNIFWRKPHYLQFLASFQVSAIPLTGQGKVGSENGHPPVRYQISQRADFFEVLCGLQTTYCRPIVNSRDESLCGGGAPSDPKAPARLHVIFFDSALAHGSALLRVGPMQMILTLMELDTVNSRLILDDPLEALYEYSRDPDLGTKGRLIGGEYMTAIELQSAYLEDVKRHAARGVFEGLVPQANEIISLWEDTLVKMDRGEVMSLAPRLDWVRKLASIERALGQFPKLDWQSPQAKVIDHMYSSLSDDGLYWTYEAGGIMERLVSEDEIARFTSDPPSDTRAWTRAMLLRRASHEGIEVDAVDWDRITFRMKGRNSWPVYRTLSLGDPLGFTEEAAKSLFDHNEHFADLIDGLESLMGDCSHPPTVAVTQ